MQELVREIDDMYKTKILAQKYLVADDIDGIFRQFYDLNRSLRYINCRYWKFDKQELNKQYLEWESENETPEMFYGNSSYWD